MMKTYFLSKLSKHLFWDIDVTKLDPEKDRHIILERVYTRGFEADEMMVLSYYGNETIKNTIIHIKYLDKKTLSYLSYFFQVPKEDFICYSKSQSEMPFGIFC